MPHTKILIINNDSDTWQELLETANDCGYSVSASHCRDIAKHRGIDYDAVILSGGWWYDDATKHLAAYKDEIVFIQQTSLPMLGICIGMQLMQLAHNGMVPRLDEPQKGPRAISLLPDGQALLGLPETVTVHKNHTLGVVMPADGFTVLAVSPDHVEIIRHRFRPMLGVQFHPEVGNDRASRAFLLRKLVEAAIGLKEIPADVPPDSFHESPLPV